MLVLTRRIGEEIVIDGNIRITIADLQQGRVKIGITAPRDIHIARAELAPMAVAATAATDDDHLERILANRAKILAPHLAQARERSADRIDSPRIAKSR